MNRPPQKSERLEVDLRQRTAPRQCSTSPGASTNSNARSDRVGLVAALNDDLDEDTSLLAACVSVQSGKAPTVSVSRDMVPIGAVVGRTDSNFEDSAVETWNPMRSRPENEASTPSRTSGGERREEAFSVAKKHALMLKFTPRRARSQAENDAAKAVLSEANDTLQRLGLLSPLPHSSNNVSQRACQPLPAALPVTTSQQIAAQLQMHPLSPHKGIREELPARNENFEQLGRQHEMVLVQSMEHDIASSAWQEERKKMESKLFFVEAELAHANAELSRTKAKLSSSNIELQVLQSQFEHLQSMPAGVRRDLSGVSSTISRSCQTTNQGDNEQDFGLNQTPAVSEWESQASVTMAESAERRALERSVQALHTHASSLRDENVALQASLHEALSRLALVSDSCRNRECCVCHRGASSPSLQDETVYPRRSSLERKRDVGGRVGGHDGRKAIRRMQVHLDTSSSSED